MRIGGERKKKSINLTNLCEKYYPSRRFQNDRVQSNNKINRKFMKYKFGKTSFSTEGFAQRRTGKNGKIRGGS